MKKRILFLVAALALLLSACGGSPSSAMAEELSAKYDFYEKSAENIKKGFDVSADDADQVFLALVDCGISSEMGYITKNADGSFKVYASGTDYTVSMDGNTLRMALPKNASKANRLYITLDATDTYTMHFFKYTAGHLNKKTFAWVEDKTVEVRTDSGVFCDSLQAIFTEVTGMYTHL